MATARARLALRRPNAPTTLDAAAAEPLPEPSEPTTLSVFGHPDWQLLKSPVLMLLGAPLVVVRHRHRILWLGLFWGMLLAAGTLWGISYAPLLKNDRNTCCHPPQLDPRHRLALGVCTKLTEYGQSHPDVSQSRCSQLSNTQIIVRACSITLGILSVVMSMLVGWYRVWTQIRMDERECSDDDDDVRAAAAERLKHATNRTRWWHALDVTLFGAALLMFSFWGIGWPLLHTVAAMGGLAVWYWLSAPLHGAGLSTGVTVVLGIAFVYVHQILLPIFRWWHCCPDGHARRCKSRRDPCSDPTKLDNPLDWPAPIWHASLVLATIDVIVLVMVGARTIVGHRVWQRKLAAWLDTLPDPPHPPTAESKM